MEAIGGRSIISWRGFLCYFMIDFIIIIMAICAIFGESPSTHRVRILQTSLDIDILYFEHSIDVCSASSLFLFQLL